MLIVISPAKTLDFDTDPVTTTHSQPRFLAQSQQLIDELQQLSSQNSLSGDENISLKKESQRLTKELDDLRQTASSAVALENNNRQLREDRQQIEHQIQSLIIENDALKESDTKHWFLIGAAVLFAGILLGIILPRLRFQKKNSWSQL